MKISEALEIIQAAPAHQPPYQVVLACGFTPLHIRTFLHAHLQRSLPARSITIRTGLFGDLAGTLRRTANEPAHAVAIALEWPDLDSRLGYRNLGGWGPAEEDDVRRTVESRLDEMQRLVENLAQDKPVALSLPTLPLPPAFHPAGWQIGTTEAALRAALYSFAAAVSGNRNVFLARSSSRGGRFDLKSELLAGVPYTIPHASRVGRTLARLLAPPSPKKGLITDLDDTLWRGIAGEIGPEAVSWDLASHSQIHGLYQQTLRALADQGVLIAIASKNDPGVVRRVLERSDLLLPAAKMFPVEVHWHAKSASVERILRQWNISADAVVFVDDSALELAEVQNSFPALKCLRFPVSDPGAAEAFLRRLRSLFGKPRLSAEDGLRRESLRQASEFERQLAAAPDASETFLSGLEGSLQVDRHAAADPRVLELVNKTNQFNLNGRRFDPAQWAGAAERPGAFVWSIAYRDKFGPLGKIAVLSGLWQDGAVQIETWAMSCRAFARRIEHQCLALLFERTGAASVDLCFSATNRNGPLQDFLAALLPPAPCAGARISRETFLRACPALYHSVQWKQE